MDSGLSTGHYHLNTYEVQPWCEIFGFFSARSLKTREKYVSFAQFVYFLREVCLLFNFIIQKLKSKHTSLKKRYKLSKTKIFFSRFEGTRGE